jgi:hypothetical protein
MNGSVARIGQSSIRRRRLIIGLETLDHPHRHPGIYQRTAARTDIPWASVGSHQQGSRHVSRFSTLDPGYVFTTYANQE